MKAVQSAVIRIINILMLLGVAFPKLPIDDDWLLRRVDRVKLEDGHQMSTSNRLPADAIYHEMSTRLPLEKLPNVSVISIKPQLRCQFFTREFPRLERWSEEGNGQRLVLFLSEGYANQGSIFRKNMLYHHDEIFSEAEKQLESCPALILAALDSEIVYRWFVTQHGPIDHETRGIFWVEHPKLEYLPIGFSAQETDRLWLNFRRTISEVLQTNHRWRNQQLFINMDIYGHLERKNAMYWINLNFNIENFYIPKAKHFITRKRENATEKTETMKIVEQYARNLTKAKFVVSPPGWGIDCVRHYEAILAGAVPIVAWSPVTAQLLQNLPVMFVRSWSELTPAALDETWARFTKIADSFELERLSRTFWLNHVDQVKRSARAAVLSLQAGNPNAAEYRYPNAAEYRYYVALNSIKAVKELADLSAVFNQTS